MATDNTENGTNSANENVSQNKLDFSNKGKSDRPDQTFDSGRYNQLSSDAKKAAEERKRLAGLYEDAADERERVGGLYTDSITERDRVGGLYERAAEGAKKAYDAYTPLQQAREKAVTTLNRESDELAAAIEADRAAKDRYRAAADNQRQLQEDADSANKRLTNLYSDYQSGKRVSFEQVQSLYNNVHELYELLEHVASEAAGTSWCMDVCECRGIKRAA